MISGLPWPIVLPFAVVAIIWGVMSSKGEFKKQEKKVERSTKNKH